MEAVSFKKATEGILWVEEQSQMPHGSEFHTVRAATLKPREATVVRTRGTDSRSVFAERRERVGCGNSEGSEGKRAEWSRECYG